MIRSKGVISSGKQVRLSKKLENELRAAAAQEGRTFAPVRDAWTLFDASLAVMPPELLDEVEAIFDRVFAKYEREEEGGTAPPSA